MASLVAFLLAGLLAAGANAQDPSASYDLIKVGPVTCSGCALDVHTGSYTAACEYTGPYFPAVQVPVILRECQDLCTNNTACNFVTHAEKSEQVGLGVCVMHFAKACEVVLADVDASVYAKAATSTTRESPSSSPKPFESASSSPKPFESASVSPKPVDVVPSQTTFPSPPAAITPSSTPSAVFVVASPSVDVLIPSSSPIVVVIPSPSASPYPSTFSTTPCRGASRGILLGRCVKYSSINTTFVFGSAPYFRAIPVVAHDSPIFIAPQSVQQNVLALTISPGTGPVGAQSDKTWAGPYSVEDPTGKSVLVADGTYLTWVDRKSPKIDNPLYHSTFYLYAANGKSLSTATRFELLAGQGGWLKPESRVSVGVTPEGRLALVYASWGDNDKYAELRTLQMLNVS